MQGREVPVKDVGKNLPTYSRVLANTSSQIYSGEKAEHQGAPRQVPSKPSAPVVGAVFSPPPRDEQKLPDIAPMRRGRVPAPSSQPSQAIKPSPSPKPVTNGDPFAALDSDAVAKTKDELSNRFPTLDQFSILHEQGVQFDFDSANSPVVGNATKETYPDNALHISQSSQPIAGQTPRAAPAVSTSPEKQVFPPPNTASVPIKPSEMSRASEIIMSTPELQAISSGSGQVFQPSPTRPSMVSTGTMTTPPMERQNSRTPSQFQIHRLTGRHSRSSSLTRNQETTFPLRKESPALRPSSSFLGHIRKTSSSSRPSLEGGRPSMENLGEVSSNSRSTSARPRPVSTHLESNLEFLRERENSSKPLVSPGLPPHNLVPTEKAPSPDLLLDTDETTIESNVDFLRSMEEPKPRKSEESKRASLSSSLGKKSSVFAGKFGDAFKRFETNQPPPLETRTASPFKALDRRDLTPIAGSEATDGRSDDGQGLEETEDMTPAMRREVERRLLADEERRVAAAQAEYRARIASRGEGGRPTPPPVSGSSRATAIQNKVQSLLDENARSSANVKRTAEGYGHYSAAAPSPQASRPEIPRKPVGVKTASASSPRPMSSSSSLNRASTMTPKPVDFSRPIPPPKDTKPMAPPKPTHLNKNLTSSPSYQALRSASPPRPTNSTTGMRSTGRLEALVAADLPGQPALDMTTQEKDDYLQDFSKRFPSLTAIEMVERDLAAENNGNKPGR